MTRVQAGKQEHELLPLRAGSEGSCSSSVSTYVRRRPVCWRLMLLVYYYYWTESAMVPMRRWVLQGCSRAVGWDCRRASEQQQDCGTALTRPGPSRTVPFAIVSNSSTARLRSHTCAAYERGRRRAWWAREGGWAFESIQDVSDGSRYF